MTKNDKCTWVAYSVAYAPTFTISKGATGGSMGLVTPNWVIHHMEYTSKAAAFDKSKGTLFEQA